MSGPEWFVRNCAVTPDEGTTVVDDCPVHWLRWGPVGADPLVLVHGGGASARWWEPLAPFLAPRWQVLAVDLSGMGDSGWRPGGYRTETWADEVLDCAATVTGGRAPVLVGHSLGGSVVAVAAASAHAQNKVNISIATGPTGGVYYPLGGGLANVLSKYEIGRAHV